MQYGLHERKTFEIQITKVLEQKYRRLNVCPQILINWSGTNIGVVTFKNSIPIRGRICKVTVFLVSTIVIFILETSKEQAKHQFRAILINVQELKTNEACNKKKDFLNL